MKKTIALLLSAALLALPVSPAVALADTTPETTVVSTTTKVEESPVVDSDGKEVKPGALPDSPLYWLDELVEKLQVALTFNPEKKVKHIERQACERLAEILALAKKVDPVQPTSESAEANEPAESSNTTAATEAAKSTTENTEEVEQGATNPEVEKKFKSFEKALKGYDAKIADAQEFLTQLEDPNSEKYKELQEALAKVNANNVIVLGNLLEKLPPQASQRLAVNIVRSMEKAVEKMEKMEEKTTPTNPNVDEDKDTDTPEAPTTEVTAPGSGTVAPVAPAPNTTKKDAKDNDKLAKKEYKELAKEAKSALKQLKKDLGLIGTDKEKSKEVRKNDKDWKDHGRDDDSGDRKGNSDRD